MPDVRCGVPNGFRKENTSVYLQKQEMPGLWARDGGKGREPTDRKNQLPAGRGRPNNQVKSAYPVWGRRFFYTNF
uniref:Uncharacterized protein n=1 Tax=Ackermannviridae sp. TaxID=2831612 RepID=A0A8S5RTY4_9CAUD|nr:MAG TPA: hypothetical protein [Ackermannviridae sp.]